MAKWNLHGANGVAIFSVYVELCVVQRSFLYETDKEEVCKNMLNGKTILVTGGTGSFGHQFVSYVLDKYEPKKIIIYSRDEYKQFIMQNEYKKHPQFDKLRFFIGDVRDKERLYRAFEGVDYVIHAAALKQVPACEYNPMEAVKTNITGAMNIVDAAFNIAARELTTAPNRAANMNPRKPKPSGRTLLMSSPNAESYL